MMVAVYHKEAEFSMVRNEFTFPSADGKTQLHGVEWLPEGGVRAVLQISHGVSEYILRYESLAEYLTARSFAVVGHDHLGHGGSVAPGGTRLYFGPKGSWNRVAEDLHTCRQRIRERFPGAPCFLLGHSMGSFLARTDLIRHPGAAEGVILMGTGQMSPVLVAGGQMIAALEERRVGERSSSPLVMQLAFGAYNKKFAPNRTAFDWLSRSTDNVDRYLSDPLCGGNPTIGLFREMLGGIHFITRPANLKNMDPRVPVLFLSGEQDPVGDCGKGVKRAFESFRRAGVRDVRCKLYPGMRHEILCEAERETVFQDIFDWLSARLPAPAVL